MKKRIRGLMLSVALSLSMLVGSAAMTVQAEAVKSISVKTTYNGQVVDGAVTMTASYQKVCQECHHILSKEVFSKSTNGVLNNVVIEPSKITEGGFVVVEAQLPANSEYAFVTTEYNGEKHYYGSHSMRFDENDFKNNAQISIELKMEKNAPATSSWDIEVDALEKKKCSGSLLSICYGIFGADMLYYTDNCAVQPDSSYNRRNM